MTFVRLGRGDMDLKCMAVKVASDFLIHKLAHRRLVLKVAYRYLMAMISPKYDQALKLQILEGVAGVPWGSWFQEARSGMSKAKRRFEETDIDPAWLDRSGGLYQIIHRALTPMIGSANLVDIEADDVIQDLVFPSEQTDLGVALREVKKILYSLGEQKRSEILGGTMSPTQAASFSTGGFRNKVKSAIKTLRTNQRRMGPTVQGEQLERVPAMPTRSRTKFLRDIVDDPRDSLGQKIREKMYEKAGRSSIMRYILSQFQQTGEMPSPTEVVDAGIAAQAPQVSRAMAQYYDRMEQAVKDPRLQRELTMRLELAGLL